ncbi:MAG: hypothetical protein M1812_008563, partial [Candelaria pacifica]
MEDLVKKYATPAILASLAIPAVIAAVTSAAAVGIAAIDKKINPVDAPDVTDKDRKNFVDALGAQSSTNFWSFGLLDKEHGIGRAALQGTDENDPNAAKPPAPKSPYGALGPNPFAPRQFTDQRTKDDAYVTP